jgi:hypothetical protein
MNNDEVDHMEPMVEKVESTHDEDMEKQDYELAMAHQAQMHNMAFVFDT